MRRFYTRHRSPLAGAKRVLPELYLADNHKAVHEVFLPETDGEHHVSLFKWLVSISLAGLVGIGFILMAFYAYSDIEDGSGIVESIRKAGAKAMQPFRPHSEPTMKSGVAAPKSDLMKISSEGLATRYVIHDTMPQRRNGREFIAVKRYVRMVASMATLEPEAGKTIPPFDPLKIYSRGQVAAKLPGTHSAGSYVRVKVVDLAGGIMPEAGGLEISDEEVAMLVTAAAREYAGVDAHSQHKLASPLEDISAKDKNTTVLQKNIFGSDDDALENGVTRTLTVNRGDNLAKLLRNTGAAGWQTEAMIEALRSVFSPKSLKPGHELRLLLAPVTDDRDNADPLQLAIYNGPNHEATVYRNSAGDYVASRSPVKGSMTKSGVSRISRRATVYKGFYDSSRKLGIPNNTITSMLRLHAYGTNFKRPVHPGDGFEAFFDIEDASVKPGGGLGNMLFTSITVNSKTRKFYRFRTPDGQVEFYDERGRSAHKFLMRKPVRGGGARLTSGFGYRMHPMLRKRKMHTGIDWAARRGTPIMAAGDGVVEFVGRKGSYGKYVRIRHANGYKTAYAHMHGFARNLREGTEVKQGQIIGTVGNTGRSTGPHLHYEVLVNNRHVNPARINVPHGRNLKGRQLSAFIRERNRINELMRRSPVETRTASNILNTHQAQDL
jgi:murein DD-endopeptidase MepM/ murein hydrolase activator NlpD